MTALATMIATAAVIVLALWLRDRRRLRQANEAFDECTSDYAKSLVAHESWRRHADDLYDGDDEDHL